ncbi:MAG: hypothetical protein XXXJIFNMEKO3_02578 [Candidatus Erwinia impunctatus]|nr:hypothetical protein XXXJIFNMEKO_02578 [Culicoides impunctatus]
MCMGYDLPWLKCRALISSAVMCSLAGMLLAWYSNYVSPDYLLPSETFLIWNMVMTGGVGNVRGVLPGVVLVEALQCLTRRGVIWQEQGDAVFVTQHHVCWLAMHFHQQ